MWLPKPLYDAKPYLLGLAGLLALFLLPMAGQVGGLLLLGAGILIYRLRGQAQVARLARNYRGAV